MPRFTMNYATLLNRALEGLGITAAFSPGRADFSGMLGDRAADSRPAPAQWNSRVFISDVRQKTYMHVDEEGTEAAAATSVGAMPTALRQIEEFIVDRPFVFVLRDDRTGAILFVGQVVNPDARGP